MRKVDLNMKENHVYEIIKRMVDNDLKKVSVASKLNCSLGHVYRLEKLYLEQGKTGFLHGNRGRSPANAFSNEQKEKVISLYCNKYAGANITHFCELLLRNENIAISDTTVLSWLKKEYILSPKARRLTKREMKNDLEKLASATTTKKAKTEVIAKSEQIDFSIAHPRRARSAYMGEVIQMDASESYWFGDVKAHLHLSIDDATGTVTGAYFDAQETLAGYYNLLFQILTGYGIPAKFLVDRRTVFDYMAKDGNKKDPDSLTQFAYACQRLGIEIEATSIPQAKGRIERLNQTFQSRLPIELRLAGISSIYEANIFLASYLPKFNEKFAIPIHASKNVFVPRPADNIINETLAVVRKRTIDSGHTLKFLGKYYFPKSKKNIRCYFKAKTKCLVIKAFDDSLFCSINDEVFALEELPERLEFSKEFDIIPESPKVTKAYIPKASHPWRKSAFEDFETKQKRKNVDKTNWAYV
ncbi:MAG: ISNCY family transposase [Anaerovoracaceae bacterium]